MRILSLFDGMACAMLALQDAGVTVDRYIAYEIDKYAIQTSSHNFPMIEHRGDVFKADFTEFEGFDFLLGGSPCTYWSVAQKVNREVEASGMGWELFQQYVRALREAKPKYFIYENNKSMSKAIRESISSTFGFEPICINSALVSAQNRQRLYWCGIRQPDGTYKKADIPQPEDRGILLKDILESGVAWQDKSFAYTTRCHGATVHDTLQKHGHTMATEPVCVAERGRYNVDGVVEQHFEAREDGKTNVLTTVQKDNCVAETVATPICHTIPQEVRVRKYTCDIKEFQALLRDSKNKSSLSNKDIAAKLNKPQTEVEHWFRTDNCFSIPDENIWFVLKDILGIETTEFDAFVTVFETKEGVFEKANRCYDINGKMSTLMTGKTDNIIIPVRVGALPRPNGELSTSQGMRIYSIDGKAVTQSAQGGGMGAKTGLYAVPITTPMRVGDLPNGEGEITHSQSKRIYSIEGKSVTISAATGGGNTDKSSSGTGLYAIPVEFENGIPTKAISCADGKTYDVYTVAGGQITIKGKQYPIKLVDGYYIIRKLTVRECMRLQTVPEYFEFPCSNSRAYQQLGNGWTILIISHLIKYTLAGAVEDSFEQLTL